MIKKSEKYMLFGIFVVLVWNDGDFLCYEFRKEKTV